MRFDAEETLRTFWRVFFLGNQKMQLACKHDPFADAMTSA